MSAPHRTVWAAVNAPVDEGIAELVEALSDFPTLSTLNSCEGGAFVTFRFGHDSSDAAAFMCWLTCHLSDMETAIFAEWGGALSLVLELRTPPSQIKKVAKRLRSLARTFRSFALPYDTERTEFRNSHNCLRRQPKPKLRDLPANLIDLIERDLVP